MHADIYMKGPNMTTSIPRFCEATGLGRSTIYKLISEDRLRTVKIGARRLIIDSPEDFFAREYGLQTAVKQEQK